MVMNDSDFEAIKAFMTNDVMNAWDAEHGCVDTVFAINTAK